MCESIQCAVELVRACGNGSMAGEDGEGLEAKGIKIDWRVVLSSGAYEKIFVGCSIVELKIRWT